MSAWTWVWYGWGAAFLVVEVSALVANRYHPVPPGQPSRRRTLSEQFWAWFHITPGRPSWSAAWLRFPAWVTAATLVWLFFHLLFGLGT